MIGCHRYLQGIQLKALIAKIVSFLADEHMPYVKEEGNIRVKCHQLMNQGMVCATGLPLSTLLRKSPCLHLSTLQYPLLKYISFLHGLLHLHR